MIFILVIILLIISIIGLIIAEKKGITSVGITCSFAAVVFSICFIVCFLEFIGNGNLAAEANKAYLIKERENLVYELENQLYTDDSGRKEIYERIFEWNTDLVFKKEAQRDFWVGIFYPNIYDEIDFIGIK